MALAAGGVDHGVVTCLPPSPNAGGRPDSAGGTTALGGESAPARGYLLDNARAEAGERFAWLAELFDGVTRGHFDRLGVRAGSRCWEVGAGGPGIPEALAAAVGPAGHVLATDIDPSWLKAGDGYEVRQHDVAADPPPEPGTFDLVHARLVLVHVPDRARALATVGGLACGRLEAATFRHVRGELLAAGLADDAEIGAHLAAIDAGELDLTLAPLISAWGRRPAEP